MRNALLLTALTVVFASTAFIPTGLEVGAGAGGAGSPGSGAMWSDPSGWCRAERRRDIGCLSRALMLERCAASP